MYDIRMQNERLFSCTLGGSGLPSVDLGFMGSSF